MGCNKCDFQCGKELEKIEKLKKKSPESTHIFMNQATYEAISGNELFIAGLKVEIRNGMKDRNYYVMR